MRVKFSKIRLHLPWLLLGHSGHPTEQAVICKDFPRVLAPYDAREMVLRLLARFTGGNPGSRVGRDFSVSPSALSMQPELGGETWGQLRTPEGGPRPEAGMSGASWSPLPGLRNPPAPQSGVLAHSWRSHHRP